MSVGSSRYTSDSVLALLRQKGLDPATAVSCIPSQGSRGAIPGVRGCNMCDRCIFDRTKYGGFKGQLPHNVGYYFKPNDGTTHQKEDFMPCYRFMFTLDARMKAGIRDRENGFPNAEIIDIVAQEGETIMTRHWGKKNPNDLTPTAEYEWKTQEVTVPAYQHYDETATGSYEATLEKRRKERVKDDPEFQMGPPAAPTRLAIESVEDDDNWQPQPEPVASGSTPTAEPVKK